MLACVIVVLNFFLVFHTEWDPRREAKSPSNQETPMSTMTKPWEHRTSGMAPSPSLLWCWGIWGVGLWQTYRVLKNSHGSTSGAGPSHTRARRGVNEEDVVDIESNPQGWEGDEVYYFKEFNRLQPPKFDRSSGPEAPEGWLFHVKVWILCVVFVRLMVSQNHWMRLARVKSFF